MHTFEITVERQLGHAWPVSVRHEPGESSLALWSLGKFEIDLSALESTPPTNKEYGLLLGKALFREDINEAFVRAAAEARADNEALRVFLNIEAEDLRALHWEQLCAHTDRGWDYLLLNQQTPFSLYLPSQIERRFAPFGRRDLRALLLVAGAEDMGSDYGLGSFDREGTVKSIRGALGEIPCTVLGSAEGAQGKPTLDELCDRITSERPTLLHIVCHGRYIGSKGETALYFPKDGDGSPVTASELISRLGRLDLLPHFVFLSTCESALPGAENGFGGLGQRLVRELGVPAVLAMTDRISIDTAEKLASTFYARLREHGEADRALGEALAGLQGRQDVTVPALFSRLGGQPLFSESLNRPLTAGEIRYGADRLKDLIQVRAPVLLADFLSQSARLQPGLQADLEALSRETRVEVEGALNALNQFSTEVCDLSFNALALGQEPPPYDARCPFRGLYPFRTEDREFFMGREALIAKLVSRLKEHPFLAVLGPSGSGKSSLVLAGVIPTLNRETAYLTPGADPLAQLESVLHSNEQIIVADQFEELFTLTTDEFKRRGFIDRLLALKEKQPVVLTMRADFWGEVATYEALKEEMQAHQELVAPMDAIELRSAIEQQTAHVGLRFEADLAQTILDDVQGEPGAMPLLQHALLLLWNRRHGRWLRAKEYRAIGGVQQAIAHTAEDVYADLPEEGKERMRDIFLRLTRLDDETSSGERRDTRRRVRFQELVPAGGDEGATVSLVKHLADARLAVTSVNPATGDEEVEVAHEALIRYWPRLRNWLEEDRAGLRVREGLREAALEWQAADRDANMLVHRGRRLEDAVLLSRQARFGLNKAEQDYLNACVALQEREQAAVERRRRAILIASIAVSVVMLALAVFGLSQAALARRQEVASLSGWLAAQALYSFDKKLDFSMLLGVEAFHRQDSPQTRSSLFGTLSTAYLDRFLQGHANQVRAVAFSPDGSVLASAANDDLIILWDFNDRAAPRQIATLQGHESWVTSIAFSPDGKTLASGSNDHTIILWDVSDPKAPLQAGRLTGHSEAVYTVAFSPNGRLLASGSGDHSILLWDVSEKAAPRRLATLEGHSDLVLCTIFSPDGRFLASSSADGSIIWWSVSDPAAPEQLAVLREQNGDIYSLAFSPDGQTLASGSADQSIVLWDVSGPFSLKPEAMPPLPIHHADAVHSLAFSPDGKTLASGSTDNTIILWDLTSWGSFRQLRGHSAVVYSLAFSPDGETLVSGSGDDSIIEWHILDRASPLQPAILQDSSDRVLSLAFSPQVQVAASGDSSGTATLWDISRTANAHRLATLTGHSGAVLAAAFGSDGGSLATGGADHKIILWDVSDPTLPGQSAAFEAHSDSVLCLAYSPDGKVLASGGRDNLIRLWDVSDPSKPRELATLPGHGSYVNSLAFSPDGKILASGSADFTAILWDTSDPSAPKKISVLTGHKLEIYSVAFAANGTVLATGSADTNVFLWNVREPSKPRQLASLTGHSGPVLDLEVSPDGKTLASTSNDKKILLWDISDPAFPRQIANLQGSADAVNDLVFDSSGKTLLSASSDGSITLWDVDPESLALRGCEVAGRNFSQAEWREFFPGEAYRKTCEQWPEGR